MKHYIEFPLGSGGSMIVEVDNFQPQNDTMRSIGYDLPEKASLTFAAALEGIKPVVEAIINNLKSLTSVTNGIEIEFGLKMTGKLGAVIALVGAESNFKVTMKLKQDK